MHITQRYSNKNMRYNNSKPKKLTSSLVPCQCQTGHVERLGVLQTLICAPVVRPKRCPTSSNPALLRS